jgi:hypothetical protein
MPTMSKRFFTSLAAARRLILGGLLVSATIGTAALPTAQAATTPWVTISPVEVISTAVGSGDGGNAWGGQQPKVARTADGVFAVYSTDQGTDEGGFISRTWQLVRRQANGTWQPITSGIAGREPASLMALPSGKLAVFAWPGGEATLWTVSFANGQTTVTSEIVPGFPTDNWPYSSAGVDALGNLCLLSSDGTEDVTLHYWACRRAGTTRWIVKTTETPHRYAYAYVMPKGAALNVVATRDTTWASLDLPHPGGFDYAFNAYALWRTTNVARWPLSVIDEAEEPWTAEYPEPLLDAQMDSYVDTSGRTHVLYYINGGTTNGEWTLRHRVVSATGAVLADVQLPDLGSVQRIIQDSSKRFYLIGSSGYIQRLRADGYTPLGSRVTIGLGGYDANGQLFIAAPRTGTLPGKTLDVAFVPGDESKFLYVSLQLA